MKKNFVIGIKPLELLRGLKEQVFNFECSCSSLKHFVGSKMFKVQTDVHCILLNQQAFNFNIIKGFHIQVTLILLAEPLI